MIASFLFHSVVHTTSLSTQRFSWTWHMPVLQTPLLAPFHKTLLQPILYCHSLNWLWNWLILPPLSSAPPSRSSKVESILAAISLGNTKGHGQESRVSYVNYGRNFSSCPWHTPLFPTSPGPCCLAYLSAFPPFYIIFSPLLRFSRLVLHASPPYQNNPISPLQIFFLNLVISFLLSPWVPFSYFIVL